MDISVDNTAIASAASEAIERGVKSAFESWNVQKSIQEHATSAILQSAVNEAVDTAIDNLEVEVLAETISKELLAQVKLSAVMVLEQATVNLLVKMRASGYQTSAQEEELKRQVLAEVRARRAVTE